MTVTNDRGERGHICRECMRWVPEFGPNCDHGMPAPGIKEETPTPVWTLEIGGLAVRCLAHPLGFVLQTRDGDGWKQVGESPNALRLLDEVAGSMSVRRAFAGWLRENVKGAKR